MKAVVLALALIGCADRRVVVTLADNSAVDVHTGGLGAGQEVSVSITRQPMVPLLIVPMIVPYRGSCSLLAEKPQP